MATTKTMTIRADRPEEGAGRRIERLSTASAKRVLEPDDMVQGDFGPGQILPDELLITFGLDLELDEQTRNRLAREQTAATLEAGVRLEAILLCGFGALIAEKDDITDP